MYIPDVPDDDKSVLAQIYPSIGGPAYDIFIFDGHLQKRFWKLKILISVIKKE